MISFTKMQGSGNDFILIDNRDGVVADADKLRLVQTVCPRRTAIGADGVIFIENDDELDFRWHFFNADGSEAEMCGNGARCAAVFANNIGAAGTSMSFRTVAGAIRATLVEGGARVQLTDAALPQTVPGLDIAGTAMDAYFINTGVPHVVVPVDDIEAVDIKTMGAAVRYHERFAPAGTNANFVQKLPDGQVAIRTYERGVEDETLACGTGSVATAIIAHDEWGMASPVTVKTRCGVLLTISYTRSADGISEVFLEGPVEVPYEGQFEF